MSAFYNEIDPVAAAWLRSLIDAGLIAPGVVDERSIVDVEPDDLVGYAQCHFFAGIGGWSCALRLAGWPDDKPIWTGSPPCQPFSVLGRQKGYDDDRHLAPHWLELVRECRPAAVAGEQVTGAIKHEWLDDLQDALEAEGYATAATVLPACSVGAHHLRPRIFFVGRLVDGVSARLEGHDWHGDAGSEPGRLEAQPPGPAGEAGRAGGMADDTDRPSQADSFWSDADWLFCRDGKWRPVEPGTFPLADGIPGRVGRLRGYGNAIVPQAAAEVLKVLSEHMEGK